jgi:hypothetical protein
MFTEVKTVTYQQFYQNLRAFSYYQAPQRVHSNGTITTCKNIDALRGLTNKPYQHALAQISITMREQGYETVIHETVVKDSKLVKVVRLTLVCTKSVELQA